MIRAHHDQSIQQENLREWDKKYDIIYKQYKPEIPNLHNIKKHRKEINSEYQLYYFENKKHRERNKIMRMFK